MKKTLKILFLIVNVAVVVLFLLSTLAGYHQPVGRISVGVSLLSYGYVIFFILNILCSVIWLIFGSRWFLLSIAAIAVRISFVPLYFQIGTGGKTDEEAARLTVMDYNLHHYCGPETDYNLQDTNATLFLKLVRQTEPDILCLQEYAGDLKKTKVTDSLKAMGYTWCASAQGKELKRPAGTVVFSKYRIIEATGIENECKFYADIEALDDTLRLFCFHLDSYELTEKDKAEMDRISRGELDSVAKGGLLRKFATTIKRHGEEWCIIEPLLDGGPQAAIYCGDWNDTPASYFYQNMSRRAVDSYKECGSGFSTTYHGPFPAFRIDYVCHSDALKATQYKRIRNNAISDHYPLLVTLEKADL